MIKHLALLAHSRNVVTDILHPVPSNDFCFCFDSWGNECKISSSLWFQEKQHNSRPALAPENAVTDMLHPVHSNFSFLLRSCGGGFSPVKSIQCVPGKSSSFFWIDWHCCHWHGRWFLWASSSLMSGFSAWILGIPDTFDQGRRKFKKSEYAKVQNLPKMYPLKPKFAFYCVFDL